MSQSHRSGHDHSHAFASFRPREPEGLVLAGRRNLLKASVAGLAGLSLPGLLRQEAAARGTDRLREDGPCVILLWMAGGPSHIDTWDPKPERPTINRGPFGVTRTKQPGVLICEHLPKMAAMLDRFTLIRSIDCRGSNHQPNLVMQTGNRDAAPRVNPKGDRYPAVGAVAAKFCGPTRPGAPAYVAFQKHVSHVAQGGWLGREFDPFIADRAARLPVYDTVGKDTGQTSGADLFQLAPGLDADRLTSRRRLAEGFDRLRRDLDLSGSMEAMDEYRRQAVEMLLGRRVQQAFDLSLESEAVRQRYGEHLWCRQALLARRLVQAGARFVTLDLSYHPASGTWDTHGDNIPPYGGISKGLGPLLPLFDHLVTTLVADLEAHDLLGRTLVVAMGEFGRTPNMGTQGSTDGRNHWPNVSSIALAGGGLNHGQVIGATGRDGGEISERPVSPGDLAATLFRHLGVPLDATYEDDRNRPRYVVEEGQPVGELF